MSERLPYEEQLLQQWNDLPLPDENMAWEDMKRRLEEDDDDGIIVWWRRGCALWGLLLLLLIAAGWWWMNSNKTNSNKTSAEKLVISQNDNTANKDVSKIVVDTLHKINQTETTIDTTAGISIAPSATSTLTTAGNKSLPPVKQTKMKNIQTGNGDIDLNTAALNNKNEVSVKKPAIRKVSASNNIVAGKAKTAKNEKASAVTTEVETPLVASSTVNQLSVKMRTDSATNKKTDALMPVPDSAMTVNKKDSVKKKTKPPIAETKTSEEKKDSTKASKHYFSAGIALQQQLPIDGQTATPYNKEGRKGTLGDYIPSVYARYTKEKKWFVQTEFRYGAPQYNKELLYGNKSKQDTSAQSIFTSTTLQKLKKTYYHQVFLNFNYYVLPGWSVGTGINWNKFVSAVSEVQVNHRDNATLVDSVISNQIVSGKTNSSVFSKSYFMAHIETQYQWKRFSIGGRYAFGLQPYIKFTLQNSTEQREKNSSVQVFLRYEIWRSKSR